jgi:hypothetical protein
MRLAVLAFILIAMTSLLATSDDTAAQTDFTLCESTYALCTTAPCEPVAEKPDTVSCTCKVLTAYSAGLEPCQSVKETSEGKQVRSRYSPVKAYAVCTNDRPWAWCLDKPCVIDKNDPTKASCACTTVKDQGPYVIVTDTYTKTTCTTGTISSATVTQIGQVTDFLKGKSELPPFPIKVLNRPK